MNGSKESETTSDAKYLLLLDACCAINLLASGEARAIISALEGVDVAVASLVAEQEVLKVAPPPKEDATDEHSDEERTQTTLTLDPLVDEGLIIELSPEGEQEETTYVDLALQLDDGEAMTGSLAIHRGGSVATDDRKAIRVLGAQSPAPKIRRTSWLVRTWAESTDIDQERLRSALRNIEQRGSFFPPSDDPLLDGWRRVTGRD